MNILYSTTIGYNLGDEVIMYSVRKLMDEIFPGHNCFIYNRNPDLWHGQHWHGNYLNYAPDYIDLIVLAGTPEWYLEKLHPLYLTINDRPVWAIGIGWGVEKLMPGELTMTVIQNENYRIIARSEVTMKIIHNQYVHVLPCPSLIHGYKSTHDKFLDCCFIGDSVYMPDNLAAPQYCYTIDEFEKNKSSFYITTVNELFNVISQYRTVYTSRLHAGFAAIGMGRKVEFMKRGFRIDTALSTYYAYPFDLSQLKDTYIDILGQWKNLDF